MNYLNRTVCYERTQEEIAYFKVKSVGAKRYDTAALTKIKTREDYPFTRPDQVVRYEK